VLHRVLRRRRRRVLLAEKNPEARIGIPRPSYRVERPAQRAAGGRTERGEPEATRFLRSSRNASHLRDGFRGRRNKDRRAFPRGRKESAHHHQDPLIDSIPFFSCARLPCPNEATENRTRDRARHPIRSLPPATLGSSVAASVPHHHHRDRFDTSPPRREGRSFFRQAFDGSERPVPNFPIGR